MTVNDRLAGFKYIYETDHPDVAVVRFYGTGLLGMLRLSKLEFVIRRNHPDDGIVQCCVGLTKGPLWALQDGSVEEAQNEVQRWANPILHQAMLAASQS